jgi:transcriptional regulator of heat shock response
MGVIKITERQAHILYLVIREYIATAQPVASACVARRIEPEVSPATVRNELLALEYAGLLSQPHISAGRVPTNDGYRYYVRHLMDRGGLPAGVRRAIRHQIRSAGANTERLLRLSASIVAHAAGTAGLVTGQPSPDGPRLYHAGLTEILGEPELSDGECLRVVVEILEYGTGLQPLIDQLPAHGVEVVIGGLPPLETVPHVTLVLSRFGGQAREAGVVGAIGPTRLPYDRAVPAVAFVANAMTHLLAPEAD